MYKKIILGIVLGGWVTGLPAQGASPTIWEQITALQSYIVTTEKGYRLVEKGWQGIGDINFEEFNLHHLFFSYLSAVNPAIKNSPPVSAIIRMQANMIDRFADALARWMTSPWLQPTEGNTINQIYVAVIKECTENLTNLQKLLADSLYIMTDGERMRGIETIATIVKAQNKDVSRYIRGMDALIAWRQREQEETGALERWIVNF
ncbi:MAG TPA: hypothetical protein VNS58_02245 [Puia sp.]|nr:hypothetical protein [Puia sp.]